MKAYIFSVIIGAAAVEFAFDFLPLADNSPMRRYLKYICALVLALCICAPLSSLCKNEVSGFAGGFPEFDTADRAAYEYLYFVDGAVYEADADGNIISAVACDAYIRSCAENIIADTTAALERKFSRDDLSLSLLIDTRKLDEIELVRLYISSQKKLPEYLAGDICAYSESLTGAPTVYINSEVVREEVKQN